MQNKEPFVLKKSLKQLIPSAPKNAIDLISKLLTYDPDVRLSSDEALMHEFFSSFEPKYDLSVKREQPLSYFDFEFEQYTLNSAILKELFLDEVILTNDS